MAALGAILTAVGATMAVLRAWFLGRLLGALEQVEGIWCPQRFPETCGRAWGLWPGFGREASEAVGGIPEADVGLPEIDLDQVKGIWCPSYSQTWGRAWAGGRVTPARGIPGADLGLPEANLDQVKEIWCSQQVSQTCGRA